MGITEFGGSPKMTEKQIKKHKELSKIIEGCLSASKIDTEKLKPSVEKLIAIAGDSEAAVETRMRAIKYITEVVSSSAFKKEERIRFRDKLSDAVKKSNIGELHNTYKAFESALAKKDKEDRMQSSLDSIKLH